MTELTTTFRTLGPSDAVLDDYVVPYYLDDRVIRVSTVTACGLTWPSGAWLILKHQKIPAHPRPAAGQ